MSENIVGTQVHANCKIIESCFRRTISKGPSNSWRLKEGNGLQGKSKDID